MTADSLTNSSPTNSSPRVWYFAFGSNLDVSRLYEARLKPRGAWMGRRLAARLDGWTLKFNVPVATPGFEGCGVGNIEKVGENVERATVWGTINEMDVKGLEVLDYFEQVSQGMYRRESLSVYCPALDQPVEVVAYVAACKTDDSRKPSKDYLNYFLAGRDVLPAEYVKKLESVEVIDKSGDPNSVRK
jgi:gamma-glutamylcyclotransferase